MTWTECLLTGCAWRFWTDGWQKRQSGLGTGPRAEGIWSLQQTACPAEERQERLNNMYIYLYIHIYVCVCVCVSIYMFVYK